MNSLVTSFQPYASNPEDYWFRGLLFCFLLIFVIAVMGSDAPLSRVQTRATHGAIKVSLNLLKQQADSNATKIQRPRHKQKPAPVIKPTEVASPKKKLKPVPVMKPLREKPSQRQARARAPVLAAKVIRGASDETLVAEQRYLSMLLTHVEGYKFYPPLARRRGIEGNIDVSFRLLRTGQISRLQVSNGPVILRQAAEHAIHASLPMPVPPTEVVTPKQLSFVMAYQLN